MNDFVVVVTAAISWVDHTVPLGLGGGWREGASPAALTPFTSTCLMEIVVRLMFIEQVRSFFHSLFTPLAVYIFFLYFFYLLTQYHSFFQSKSGNLITSSFLQEIFEVL